MSATEGNDAANDDGVAHQEGGDGSSVADGASRPRWMRRMAFFGELAPFIIVAYAIVLAATRYGFSPFLEVDEAEFVGQVAFQLIYDNSHPPLYNWLVRLFLEISMWDWALALSIVKFGLLASYHYFTWDSVRRLAGPGPALTALAAAAFMPQIVWMSAVTLAHSVLVLAAAAACVNALVRLTEHRDWRNYLFLGAAAAAGLLGKFNFALFLIPFAAVIAALPATRGVLADRRALIALGAVLVLAGPTYLAAALDLETSAERIDKLYRAGDGLLAWIDPPYVGVDGFVKLITSTLAWGGLGVLAWVGARWWDGRLEGRTPEQETPATEALGFTMLAGLTLFAVGVLAADVHNVSERYLTPLLAGLPVYLAVAWPLRRASASVALAGAVLYAAVFVAYPAMVANTTHRYAIDFSSLAGRILREIESPEPIFATRHDDRANVLVALEGWPGHDAPTLQTLGNRAILLWRGRGDPPSGLAPEGFGPAGPIVTHVAPYRNNVDGGLPYRFQLWERIPERAAPQTDADDAPAETVE